MNDCNLDKGKNTQFQPGQSGNPTGRKPSRLKKFIKDFDVTKSDIDALVKNILFNYSFDDLRKLYKSLDEHEQSSMSAGVAALVSGILHDVKRGDIKATNSLLDRVYGKPKESMDISGGLQLFTITQDEQDAL